jgi:dCTP deaminase
LTKGSFCLAASRERFIMPGDVLGVVHDKSTLARRGLSVFNTVIEPGWKGYLTLELIHHGPLRLTLMNGQPIAQVVFHLLDQPTDAPYAGKYQDQAAGAQGPR